MSSLASFSTTIMSSTNIDSFESKYPSKIQGHMPYVNIGQYLTEHNIADELTARYGTRFYESVNQLRDLVLDSRTQIRRVLTLTAFMMLGYFKRYTYIRNTFNLSHFDIEEDIIRLYDYFCLHKVYSPIWFYRCSEYYTIDYSIPINHFISYLYRERGYTSLSKYVCPKVIGESLSDYECTICMNEFQNMRLANMRCTEKPVFPCMNEKKICPTCVESIKGNNNICPFCKDCNTFYLRETTAKMIYSHNRKKYTFDFANVKKYATEIIIFDTKKLSFISSPIRYELEEDMLYDDEFIFENITSIMSAEDIYSHLSRRSERLVGNSPNSSIFSTYIEEAHNGDYEPIIALFEDDAVTESNLRVEILNKYPVGDRCAWFNRKGWGHVECVGVNTSDGVGYVCIQDATISDLLRGQFETDRRLVFWGVIGNDYAFDKIRITITKGR